mmetsp:Transcript_19788/g.35910  ORF Transcript_19788/g.35910 Transcript_19788/m.35910 type:complete len:289 (+) Transcript_19788:109-975(+)
MVVCRNGKESKPSATSYGRLHDVARKHSNTKKNHSKQSSTKKVTRASVGEVSTPPELKRAREEEEDETKSGASTLPPKKLSRHTYGGPRCFHYGPNRHILYKGEGFLFSFIYPNVKKKESRYNGPPSRTDTHTTLGFCSSIAAVVDKHRRMGPDRVGKIIAEAAWDAAEGAGQRELIKKSSKWIRDNVYTAWGVLRKMDINGGTLGLQGLEVARSVETNDRKYYRGSLLPCKADILRCQKIVEEFGDEFVRAFRGCQNKTYPNGNGHRWIPNDQEDNRHDGWREDARW